MTENILFALADLKLFHPVEDLGDISFKALFGFGFVVAGIAVLILIFTLLGFLMKKANGRKPRQRQKTEEIALEELAPTSGDGISPEIVAVISAAVAAYYEGTAQKCDFVVRRIKKL